MDADEIQPLTAQTVGRLLESRRLADEEPGELAKRRSSRWAFPGAVEMWVADQDGAEVHTLGVCHNLSERGVGVRCDEPLTIGVTLPVAIHQPEASLHGKGIVRHCTPRDSGYLVGIEFVFEGA